MGNSPAIQIPTAWPEQRCIPINESEAHAEYRAAGFCGAIHGSGAWCVRLRHDGDDIHRPASEQRWEWTDTETQCYWPHGHSS